MATPASDTVSPSPAKRRKWSRLAGMVRPARGSKYEPVPPPAEPPSPALPTFPQPPEHSRLLQVICDSDLESQRKEWVQWLQNEHVPDEMKRDQLYLRDDKGWTPLHHAARFSRCEVLDAAAKVEEVNLNVRTDREQLTPLLVAAKYNVKDSVLWMVQNKDEVDLKAVDCNNRNALHLVVYNQNCESSIETLLRQLDYGLRSKKDCDGNIPLHIACAHNNLKALEHGLLKPEPELWEDDEDSEGGSDDGSKDSVDGGSAGGSGEGSGGELDGGSDGGPAGGSEESQKEEGGDEVGGPISIRVENEMKKMILETDNKKRTPLHLAAKNGHYKVVAMLIKICREAIKCRDMHEDMALHLACRKGHLNVVKEIMEWEPTTIGPKYVNTKGETAIHCAAYNSLDSGALMEYLLGVCKDNSTLDVEDILNLHEGKAKHTPLMLACTKGKPEIVKVLLRHGADVSQQEGKGQEGGDQEKLNSLELAIENGRREVTKVIVDKNRKDWKRGMRAGNIIDGVVNTPFRRMIRKMPDVAMLVLNNCTKEKNDRDDVDFAMTFDYEFVEDFQSGMKKEAPGASNLTFSNVETDSGHAQASNKMFDDAERDSADVFLGEDDVDGVQLKEVVTYTDGGKRTALRDAETDSADVHLGEDDVDGALLKTCTDGRKITPGDTKGSEHWKPKEYEKKNHVLHVMVENNRSELLQHPLVTSLLNHKWNRFGAWFYFANLFFYLIYVIFLTAFALVVPNPQSDRCELENGGNSTESCDYSNPKRNFLYFISVVTIVLALARLLIELIQLVQPRDNKEPRIPQLRYKVHINLDYFLDWTNYLEIVLYVFSIAFVAVFNECACPTSGQWQIGTVAVFFAWINLVLFLYKLPKIGIYVGMMLQIVRRFLSVVLMAFLLSLAFGFAFYMAFYEPTIPASPFINPALSFITLMVMTAGGPDGSIFRFTNEGSGERDALPFPEAAYFIWVIFIIVMAILFVNFLVGLAVDDVKEIQQSATLNRLSLKVDLVLSWEEAFSFLRQHKWFVVSSDPIHPNERLQWHKRLWKKFYSLVWDDDLALSIQTTLNPEENTDYRIDQLKDIIEKQEKMIKEMDEKQERLIREMDEKQEKMMNEIAESLQKIQEKQDGIAPKPDGVE